MCVKADTQMTTVNALGAACARAAKDVTERYRALGYFPDAAVRVFQRERTLCAVYAGSAAKQSLFDVASLTKIATATQILLRIDSGELSLNDEIGALLPDIAKDAYLCARLAGVTVLRLLTHTSSIVDWYPFYSRRGEGFYQALRFALEHTKPTEGVVYSDLNFMLLGKALERLSGLPLDECLQAHLVKPLGLGRMGYRPMDTQDVIPSGYGNPTEEAMCRERGITFAGFRPVNEPVRAGTHDGNAHYYFDDAAGHAGVFASPEAYERLCRFYMNTDRPIFAQALREQPCSPTRGLGFQMGAMYPYGCGHTGFTGTSIWFSKDKDIGVVAFTNRLYYKGYLNDRNTGDYRRALHEAVLSAAETLKEG